ncbi:MAG TPA: formate dehydrogenase, partial [Woeseiaceae bacterium]|nr:formate dehydrogenase [Woeseiaceae bacterium]
MNAKVFVPRETAAVSMGADEVAARILARSGGNRGPLDLVRNGSWGMSWLEPLVEVLVDGERIAYGPVSPEDVDELFEAGFLQGGDHRLRLGPTAEIPWLANQDRWTFARCGMTDPLSADEYLAHGGLKGLRRAFELGSAGVLDELQASGLRGRGGAGFPTAIKWQTVANAAGDRKYIACNADEGDSGTFSDRLLMEGDPFTLIEGMAIAGFTVGANLGYVYLRSEYPLARTVFTKALAAARAQGWLGRDIQG